ncbi:MAG: hypothetical protein QM758_00110 [Armatimonas sp.]
MELRRIRGQVPGKGKLVVLDFVAHWSTEEPTWRNPTNRMARAWIKDLTWIEIAVWEQEKRANTKLARALPHPNVLLDSSGVLRRWLEAQGGNSLPLTLLFSQQGNLLFSGQPFELPGVLERVRIGRFNPDAVYALQQKREAEAADRAQLVGQITAQEKAGRWREAIALIDTGYQRYVPEHQAGLLVRHFKILHKNALPEALSYAKELEASALANEFPWLLHDLVLEVADKEKPTPAEFQWAIGLMERLLKNNPTRPSYWDTLAELRYESGDRKGALVAQNQAVRFIDKQLDLTDEERASILRWQENYRRPNVRRRI